LLFLCLKTRVRLRFCLHQKSFSSSPFGFLKQITPFKIFSDSEIMEMERVHEFPHTHMDRRPRKRARLGWDVLPQATKV
jgi:hypothetical protein